MNEEYKLDGVKPPSKETMEKVKSIPKAMVIK